MGGTGKTPLTLYLAEHLQAAGWTNVVLSRGYGGRRAVDPMDVQPDSDPAMTGDEPLLMARRLGRDRVVVAKKRHAGALRALSGELRPRVLLLDDGFQHRALHRDVDLLLLDGVRGWGNGKTLPLGDMREPMDSAKRAHALVVTRGQRADRAKFEAWWAHHGSGGPIFWIDFAIGAIRDFHQGIQVMPHTPLGPLLAFCALGHPEAFYADLLVAGFSWVDAQSYRDHRALGLRELLALQNLAMNREATGLVCTEKDAVKLGYLRPGDLTLPLWVAEQHVLGAEPLLQFLKNRLETITRG
jgi:tetraacyldisaccharide 4'-kinase